MFPISRKKTITLECFGDGKTQWTSCEKEINCKGTKCEFCKKAIQSLFIVVLVD